jgi:isopenicillin N synthase-like dioxygenase
MSSQVEVVPAVTVDYSALQGDPGPLRAAIAEAFGSDPHCLGIIVVKGVPGVVEARRRLLPLAATFAQLPDADKAQYEDAASFYSFGWSHGKEKFNGIFDTAKGSFYANPQYDRPFSDEELAAQPSLKQLVADYPEYCAGNVWPRAQVPDLEGAFKSLGQLIVGVGLHVARHCDDFVASVEPSFAQVADQHMSAVIDRSRICKARLLHYFPYAGPADGSAGGADGWTWCGWHFDHSSLTGLASAMYCDATHDNAEVPCPDPEAGLYIETRGGRIVRVATPPDALAFQMGEATQILTGGILRATKHYVRGAAGEAARHISRNTLAVFMQPNITDVLNPPPGRSVSASADTVGVRMWHPNENFGEFSRALFKEYY